MQLLKQQHACTTDWRLTLSENVHGRKVLTLDQALAMAARGDTDGWYVAPYATAWTVGRTFRGDGYHVLLWDDEPMWFPSYEAANSFLGMLRTTA